MIFDPPAWSGYELDAMRVLLALVMLTQAWPWEQASTQDVPIGVARLLDLTWLARPAVRRWSRWSSDLAVLLYVGGWAPMWALLWLSLVFGLTMTLKYSSGMVSHGHHLVAVTLVAQAAAHVTWELGEELDADLGRLVLGSADATAVWWTVQAIAAAYFVSGVTKVARSSLLWSWDSPALLLHLVSRSEMARHEFHATDRARSISRAAAEWLVQRPAVTRVMFSAGLLVELAAPLGLVNRTTLVVAGGAFLALHFVNGVVLLTRFRLFELIVLIYFVNVPYLAVEAAHLVGID